jgi:YidC/Oxa1 family membrane protein insertase
VYGLESWIYYGWFGLIARFLSSVLHFFYAILGNYGIAIILLTVLVRSCMFPISRTAARNAAMMQELAPEMRKIAEKHKNNLEARGKAQQELFRQHNYNPLSGCWLMFLQLPVFVGLYRCLAIDIELRQAPLIPGIEWCSNLAGPDKLFYWKNDFFSYFTDESGWLGPYFNLLPIFTIVLFLLHQKLFTPPATDEQTEMQMKMMKIMTVFMGVLFYKVPAGLCLYFITSSLWGIAERKLLPKPTPKKKDEGGGGGGGGSKLANLFGLRKPPPDQNGNTRKKELERKMRRNR